MITQTINEIRHAINNELYFIALMGALTLPDICGKAEYPNEKTSVRYKNWIRKYVYNNIIDADIIYKLRCNILHQGTPSIENVDYFELIKENPFSCHKFQCFIENEIDKIDGVEKIISRKISINIAWLSCLLCYSAESYYRNNKNKFVFIKYNLFDVDYYTKNIFYSKNKSIIS